MDKANKESGNGTEDHVHHPWDDVSLPGAGTNILEQPTILQVLNNVNAATEEQIVGKGTLNSLDQKVETNEEQLSETEVRSTQNLADNAQTCPNETKVEDVKLQTENFAASDNLVNSHSNKVAAELLETAAKNCSELSETPTEKAAVISTVESVEKSACSTPNVLDIESHLIETYEDNQANEDSIGIKELAPINDELTQGTSKVETDINVRSVIEVEPAGAKTKQPIETQVPPSQRHLTARFDDSAEDKTTAVEERQQIISDEIIQTAEKLVNEIEQQVLETLSKVAQAKLEAQIEEAKELEDSAAAEKVANEIIFEAQLTNEQKTEEQLSPTLLDDINSSLSQKVDEQLSEVTSILKASKHGDISFNLSGVNGEILAVEIDDKLSKQLKLVDVPLSNTPLEAEERKLFIESLPHIETDTDASKLVADCKREYYQSLKKYLIQSTTDKPPVPLQTYRWEDLKRAKERGGYPWTHLYKRPLGPDEEPEIVLMLRKSQELRFTSESPKSLKKVRIDEQVLVKEAERYIQELSEDEDDPQQSGNEDDTENHSLHSESISCVSDSILAVGKPVKSNRLTKIRGILKRRKSGRSSEDAQSLPGTSTHTSRHHSEENLAPQQLVVNGKSPEHKSPRCYPIMKKLKSMADRQKKRLNIKRITLRKDEKIDLGEETKIMKLKSSPKSERGEIPHFIEKQDSDDILEIIQLDESPSRKHKDDGRDEMEKIENVANPAAEKSIVEPDEIIEITNGTHETAKEDESQTAVSEAVDAPRKTPRLRREHVYEEIEQGDEIGTQLNDILEMAQVEALKQSLAKQDNSTFKDIETANKNIPLDRMGSSEEEQLAVEGKPTMSLLAPLSSIDSASSDEDRNRPQLSPVAEESEAGSIDGRLATHTPRVAEENEQVEFKSSIKKEASPAPSDKKVTFSHVEDEAEPHREDIELPEDVMEAAAASHKWKDMSDHEYEPIAAPSADEKQFIAKEPSPAPIQMQFEKSKIAMDIEVLRDEMQEAQDLQKDLEERYFSSEATTPRTDSRTDYEIHTSQVDSSALEELPLKPENRKKGFMASAQDRTRKMQAGFKNQAGKIKTKLRSPAKKPPSGSPKAKERKRFKAPEFSKMKMPEIKRPDMSKLKDFKRPEFTKFNKPDMSKFKLPEKFSTLKLRRSKSFKENETVHDDEMSGITPESAVTTEAQPQKKMFEFNFGTYPRAFRKKKQPVEEAQSSFETGTATNDPSIIPSTETQPSVESSSSPQGDRGPGPVRSRWADKFSDVSYNDSEGSRYRRYGSEQESFDRESSLERRMKEDLEETGSEAQEMGILGGVADNKQFAEFDEENRAIHEISNLRAGEFKRRPMVHQDSDLRSEDSKEAVGWTDKEIQKNKLLRKAELEAEASYLKYPSVDGMAHETQSTASSGKKVVMEEIDDDEFFLRKRGISEDNIEFRQYISDAIREGYDMPINALQHVGQTSEPIEYGDYDVPPPKPRRLHKNYRPEDVSQEFDSQRSEYGDDLSMSQNGSDFFGAPKRPLRKGRSRSKYSVNSQDVQMVDDAHVRHEHYFDDDEEYLRPPQRTTYQERDDEVGLNNLDFSGKQVFAGEPEEVDAVPQPQAPRRRKRQQRESSMDKDPFVNGFSGRSVSNSYLQPTDNVIVYRTEHEYHIPLATPENLTDGASRQSRSISRFDEDDRTSRGADSLALDTNLRADMHDTDRTEVEEKFIIDMMENDGYAVVRKEPMPKPTPPARRKKFSRSPGERFATMPNMRTKRNTPPPERPPPPRGYTPTVEASEEPVLPQRKSALSLDAPQKYEDDYEEPEAMDYERPESPRNLQTGEIINKMKYRPLPPPPRPPREKRLRGVSKGSTQDEQESNFDERDDAGIATSSTADSYDQNADFDDDSRFAEVEVSTQTDPLPDDFVCEEFEITDDMKVIEPRRPAMNLDEMLKLELEAEEQRTRQETEDEQLARGLQKFRDANQRSISERSRASSQADRSRSLSRPQTPSAVVIERRVSTPLPSQQNETMLEASLIVRPIDDLDLEEEELRREGLLTDSSQQSKSDVELEDEEIKAALSDASHAPSSVEIDEAVEELRSQIASSDDLDAAVEELRFQVASKLQTARDDEEVERTMRDYEYDDEQAERFSSHYDEEEAEEEGEEEEETQVKEALTKLLADATMATSEDEIKSVIEAATDDETKSQTASVGYSDKEDVLEDPVKYDYDRKKSEEREQPETALTAAEKYEQELFDDEITPPQPPPRRKSTTIVESSPLLALVETVQIQEIAPVESLESTESQSQPQLPTRLGELEVERLRVHALQAGQIMVSHLHGAQISADDLECKSGSLVVKNIELPPGFIEDIVERVRSTDRSQLLTTETQTSLQASSETLPTEGQTATPVRELVPPPKPPRQKDLEAAAVRTAVTPLATDSTLEQLRNLDEETQTEASATSPPVYATAEYLQSLAPLAFYNLRRAEEEHEEDRCRRRHHHHHHHHKCESSSSEVEDVEAEEQDETHRRRHRSRSSTHPRETPPQTVAKAGSQFISACSLSLVNIINQLTNCIRGDKNQETVARIRQVPTLVVIFIVITFALLLFLLSGRNVHTHHWDYFNPPGNEGRGQS